MMNNIKCLDYESEATGNYVQVWSASRCLLLGENPSQKIIIICFSYSKCLIEILIHIFGRGRREMEESLRAQRLRGTQNHVHWEAQTPPIEGDLEGPRSRISAKGPEFLATALRAIPVLPRLLFHYCNPTEECFCTSGFFKDMNIEQPVL